MVNFEQEAVCLRDKELNNILDCSRFLRQFAAKVLRDTACDIFRMPNTPEFKNVRRKTARFRDREYVLDELRRRAKEIENG